MEKNNAFFEKKSSDSLFSLPL